MRKNVAFSLVFLLLTLATNCAQAQQEKGQIVINMGVGYSPEFDGEIHGFISGGPVYPVGTYIKNYDNGIFVCSSIIPNLGGIIDYGLSKRFSIGLASSYQSEIVSWSPDNTLPDFSDKITRISMTLRVLYHLNKKYEALDPYIGIRSGYCYWHDVPSISNYIYGQHYITFINNPNWFVPCFQVLFGMRIYISENIGFHFEAGIGEPYLVEGGLTLRINTKKSNTAPPN